jgi:hypothetical protein
MRENRQPHLIKQRDRLTYGAVPLEPWTAAEETGRWLRKRRETYLAASVLRIHDASQAALMGAIEQGWVESPDLAKQLHGVIETSLYDSQSRRMDLNPGKLEHGMVDEDDPRYEKAKNGTATPGELISLLVDYPKLNSLEVAKLTHPLDTGATAEMDSEVMYTLAYMGFEFIDEPGRYKTKTKRLDIPAITVLRKQDIGRLETESGAVQVVRRQAFLVRGDDEACGENDMYLRRKVANEGRHDEVFDKIEASLSCVGRIPEDVVRERKWFQPLATSYYAKLVDTAGGSFSETSDPK